MEGNGFFPQSVLVNNAPSRIVAVLHCIYLCWNTLWCNSWFEMYPVLLNILSWKSGKHWENVSSCQTRDQKLRRRRALTPAAVLRYFYMGARGEPMLQRKHRQEPGVWPAHLWGSKPCHCRSVAQLGLWLPWSWGAPLCGGAIPGWAGGGDVCVLCLVLLLSWLLRCALSRGAGKPSEQPLLEPQCWGRVPGFVTWGWLNYT